MLCAINGKAANISFIVLKFDPTQALTAIEGSNMVSTFYYYYKRVMFQNCVDCSKRSFPDNVLIVLRGGVPDSVLIVLRGNFLTVS